VTGLVGMLALGAGMVASSVACAGWVVTARGGSGRRAARAATYTVLASAVVASAALQWALVTHDFSIRYVADNGGREVPLYYTVTSMWAALEGSLLLWLLVLAVFAVFAMRHVPRQASSLHAPAMAVVAAVATFFFALALGGGNAFQSVSPVPVDGPGPNPLLQDHPAMGVHPPLLYLGYVGLTFPFAYSVAALATGEVGRGWIQAVRGWTVTAWIFLTAGILLGAWWSYAVLGWGGYWAWDPVENAALLPWLTATALLHSLHVQLRRRTLRIWNLSLAMASFVLVLIGTFLTRSGVVDSVHAFTQSTLGPMLLLSLGVVLVSWLVLVVWRRERLGKDDEGTGGAVLSRQTVFLGNNLLLSAIAFTVLLGTVFPLLHLVVVGEDVSVGPPYYSRMVTPAAFALLALMAVGPFVAWDDDDARSFGRRVVIPLVSSAATVGILGIAGVGGVAVLLSVGLAVFVLVTLLRDAVGFPATRAMGARRRRTGVLLAHAGVVLAAVAVTVSSAHSTSRQAAVGPDQSVRLGQVVATLVAVDREADDRSMAARATVSVRTIGQAPRMMRPELTFYPDHSMVVATPAIDTSVVRDVYLTLLEVDPDAGTATLRLAINPLVGWLWAAGGILLLGAVLAGWPLRRRAQPVLDGSAVAGEPGSAAAEVVVR
jgi:cytochrome c-type biogenesis protein CcmF